MDNLIISIISSIQKMWEKHDLTPLNTYLHYYKNSLNISYLLTFQ